MKKFLLFVSVLTVLLLLSIGVSADSTVMTSVRVLIDDVDFSDGEGERALLYDGVTFVSLRRFCDFIGGADISWNDLSREAEVYAPELEIRAREGKPYIEVNDRIFYSGRNSFILNGILYVPLRPLANASGFSVEWKDGYGGGAGYVVLTSTGRRAERAEDVYDSEVLYWLSRIISAESRGESLLGQIAVGNVVLNRTRDKDFPDTVYDVIFDTKFGVQFTPISNGTIYNEPAEASVIAAKICLEGYSISDKILYFLNASIAVNLWVTDNREYVLTLGNHSFYS